MYVMLLRALIDEIHHIYVALSGSKGSRDVRDGESELACSSLLLQRQKASVYRAAGGEKHSFDAVQDLKMNNNRSRIEGKKGEDIYLDNMMQISHKMQMSLK